MLKIELDWAADEAPATGASDGVVVEYDDAPGPSGWPTVRVYAPGSGATAGPALWAWLRDVYGCDEDEASEFASLAEVV